MRISDWSSDVCSSDLNQLHPIITFTPDANNIRMGDVRLIGNIASDRDEYSHGIAVLAADNITLGDIYGENIRGDVLYTYSRTTSEAEHQRNLVTGVVDRKSTRLNSSH